MALATVGFLLSQTVARCTITSHQKDGTFNGIPDTSNLGTIKTAVGMALTDTAVKNFKYSGAPAGDKHQDALALYLHVKAAGKYWRMNYRFNGKQKTLALGVYPS